MVLAQKYLAQRTIYRNQPYRREVFVCPAVNFDLLPLHRRKYGGHYYFYSWRCCRIK